MRILQPQDDDAVAVQCDRTMVASIDFDCDHCIRFRCEVQGEIVPALLRFIAGESGVSGDVLQLAADAVLADYDLLLQVVNVLAQEIYAYQCVDIS